MKYVYTKLEMVKDYLLRNPGVLNEIGVEVGSKGVLDKLADDGVICVFQFYEDEELKETLGEEDYNVFVKDKMFDLRKWLEDHCFSETSFVKWLEELPEPTEEELGELTGNRNGFVREDYPKKRTDV